MGRFSAVLALVLGFSAPALAGIGGERAVVAGAGPADAAAALRLAQLAEPQSAATGDARVAIDFGTYFALVIGNRDYKNLADVASARDDAEDIAEVLTERFGFQVDLLLDGSRYEIISALAALRRELEQTDNLLVYYAGHGYLDVESDEGYWLPVDAEPDNSVNWVSNSTLTGLIRAVRAKHVIVIADSTFSGRLTRNVDTDLMTGMEQDSWIARMALRRSRTALTSGSMQPVPHPVDGPNSVFARALLETLREMTRPSDGQTVFDAIKRPVVLNADRTPQYANLNKAGHDGGDFIFVPLLASLMSGDTTVAALSPPAPAPLPEAPLVDAETIELVFWQSVANSTSVADYQAYLAQYPDGIFAPLARGRINEPGAAAPTPPTLDARPGLIEQAFWDAVADSGNALDLEAYLQQYPNGHFTDISRAMLEEIARAEAAAAEDERLAAEQAERLRLAAEEAERERLRAEAEARQRLAAEEAAEAERRRLAAQEAERQQLAAEAEAERQRLAAEQAERQRLAAQEAEHQRQAAEAAERQRLAAQEAERKRQAADAERQRLAAEEAARKRIAVQEAEHQRLADEAAEQQRLAAATDAERQRLATEEAERKRLAAREAERQRLAIEETERKRRAAEAEAERQRLVAQEAERRRRVAEAAERRRLVAAEAEHQRRLAEAAVERQRLAAEAAERQRLQAEDAERQRLAAEAAERQRLAVEEAERKRLMAEDAERERLAAEAAEHQRQLAAEAERKQRAAEQTAKANAEALAKVAVLAPSMTETPDQTFLANTGKKIPPIAAPMYLTAYASVVTGQSASAIKPLRHLVEADPALADVHNALALALFTADPTDHALALEHADIARALAPDMPQFTVTRVLTDRKQWKIAADGSARLTAAAARSLREAATVLVTMRSNAKKLGKLLAAIEQDGSDAEYPFVMPGYATLIENPKLGFTRPSDKDFARAQKSIEQKIIALRQKMIAGEEGVAN